MTIFMTIYVSILGQQKIRNFLTYGLLIREKSGVRIRVQNLLFSNLD